MSNAVLKGNLSGTGTVTLETPNTNTDRTISIPDATGTMMVSGNMPAFSAYQSSTQTLSSATWTKLQFQTEEFDTANCFDKDTNYRFQPNVAGYYQINAQVQMGASASEIGIAIYKNGVAAKRGSSSASPMYAQAMSTFVYLNGSTDYVEAYANISVGQILQGGVGYTSFSSCLVRTA